ncbi:MAG TPA: VTT domain-containing protein [Bryobacteraceae bacterium]|jgi:membrane-associated protein|nr:VTT domain-containing protein [Bryobacteraceae bacterium]
MHQIIDFLRSLYSADKLLELVRSLLGNPFGLAALFAIVFSETGLLIGVIIPADSILFTIGVASGAADVNVYLLAIMLMCAAIIGDNFAYFLGRRTGPRIFSRPQSRYFHPDHLIKTKKFYEKYGPRAVVYSRFIPVIRTCTPFISGVAEMYYPKFLAFSLLGGSLAIAMLTTLGYKLGQVAVVRQNFEKVVVGIVLLSITPIFLEAYKARRAGAVT